MINRSCKSYRFLAGYTVNRFMESFNVGMGNVSSRLHVEERSGRCTYRRRWQPPFPLATALSFSSSRPSHPFCHCQCTYPSLAPVASHYAYMHSCTDLVASYIPSQNLHISTDSLRFPALSLRATGSQHILRDWAAATAHACRNWTRGASTHPGSLPCLGWGITETRKSVCKRHMLVNVV